MGVLVVSLIGFACLAKAQGAADTFAAGQRYLSSGDPKAAIPYLERAAAAEPGNSMRFLWLGRAYARAETASVFLAPKFAIKARRAFEEAVRLGRA